jgi:hypothetical protein
MEGGQGLAEVSEEAGEAGSDGGGEPWQGVGWMQLRIA